MDLTKIEAHLKSLWNKPLSKIIKGEEVITYPTKRSTHLIVPEMSWDQHSGTGSLNNDNWAYNVHYAFRSALDLTYDTRRKIKRFKNKTTGKDERKSVPYQLWTQGYKIDFKEGDLLHSNKGFPSIQVQKAKPIEWDDNEKTIDLGIIEYELFDDVKFGHIGNIKTINQMEFLAILIFGNTP